MTLLWNTLVDLVMFGLTILFLTDSHTPLKGSPPIRGKEVHTMRFVHCHLSLDDVKLVKNALNMVHYSFILYTVTHTHVIAAPEHWDFVFDLLMFS